MHCNATRVRILLFCLCAFIFYQIFRNWPSVRHHQLPNINEHPAQRVSGTPIIVTVFYEALCPDSKNFIIKQLQPTVQKAATFVEFKLVPYGKASYHVNSDGSLNFECQHGPTECEANTYHACVIETVHDPQVLLDTIACMIRNNQQPKEAMQRCTREHHIDTEQVQKCFDSPHGAELLKQYGDATSALAPPVSFIPTVTLDGAQGRQASILKDLLAEVCKVAGGREAHPEVCET